MLTHVFNLPTSEIVIRIDLKDVTILFNFLRLLLLISFYVVARSCLNRKQ